MFFFSFVRFKKCVYVRMCCVRVCCVRLHWFNVLPFKSFFTLFAFLFFAFFFISKKKSSWLVPLSTVLCLCLYLYLFIYIFVFVEWFHLIFSLNFDQFLFSSFCLEGKPIVILHDLPRMGWPKPNTNKNEGKWRKRKEKKSQEKRNETPFCLEFGSMQSQI